MAPAKSVRVTCQPCFGCGRVVDRPAGPSSVSTRWRAGRRGSRTAACCTARAPAGPPRRRAFPASAAGWRSMNAPCGAAQIRSPVRADLVGAVVEGAEAARARARHRQAQLGEHRHLVQRDLGALPGRVGPDVLADARLPAAVGDQRHAQHQVLRPPGRGRCRCRWRCRRRSPRPARSRRSRSWSAGTCCSCRSAPVTAARVPSARLSL